MLPENASHAEFGADVSVIFDIVGRVYCVFMLAFVLLVVLVVLLWFVALEDVDAPEIEG